MTEKASLSPSVPLDARHPSASLVVSDEAYDALIDRLDASPAPNERLRRTMLGDATASVSDEIRVRGMQAP